MNNGARFHGIAEQFRHPRGYVGRLCGWLMAALNADMERAAIEQLRLSGCEHVLEIGFGPGVGVKVLTQRLPAGFVAGVDPSEVMVHQARRRCREALAQGRVDLRIGTASALPWDNGRFDAVCSVNNVQFWEELDSDLREVHRVTRSGGRLAISVHEWAAREKIPDGTAAGCALGDGLASVLETVGFSDVKAWKRRACSGSALYYAARR